MCQLKSGIILKDRVFCPDDYDSHDQMLKELGIEDTEENAMRRFVRAELVPPEMTAETMKDVSKWEFDVDQDILPEWFEKDREKYIEMMREAVKEWVKKRCIFDSAKVLTGVYFAYGNATVKAYSSATVEAYDSATVIIEKYSSCKECNVKIKNDAVIVNHRDKRIICNDEFCIEKQ